MRFVTIPALHNWQSYMPHEAKGCHKQDCETGLRFSKRSPTFLEAEVWAEPLKTKRVVCPAFQALGPLWCHCASEWGVNPSAGGRAAQQFTAAGVNAWTHWEWVTVLPIAHTCKLRQWQSLADLFKDRNKSNPRNKALNYSCWLTQFERKKKIRKDLKNKNKTKLPTNTSKNTHTQCACNMPAGLGLTVLVGRFTGRLSRWLFASGMCVKKKKKKAKCFDSPNKIETSQLFWEYSKHIFF